MVEANTKIRGVTVESHVEPKASASARHSIAAGVGRLAESTKEVAAAQLEIWKLHGMRLAALAGFGVLGIVLVSALIMYGFWLLDITLAYGLDYAGLPLWASPLIRGGLYFGLPMLALLAGWHTLIGWGSSKKEADAGSL